MYSSTTNSSINYFSRTSTQLPIQDQLSEEQIALNNCISLVKSSLIEAIAGFNQLLADPISNTTRFHCYVLLTHCYQKAKHINAALLSIANAFFYSPPESQHAALTKYYSIAMQTVFAALSDRQCLDKALELIGRPQVYPGAILLLFRGIQLSTNPEFLKRFYFEIIIYACSIDKVDLATKLFRESQNNIYIKERDFSELKNNLSIYLLHHYPETIKTMFVRDTLKKATDQLQSTNFVRALSLFDSIIGSDMLDSTEKIKIYRSMIDCVQNPKNSVLEIQYTTQIFLLSTKLIDELECLSRLNTLYQENNYSWINSLKETPLDISFLKNLSVVEQITVLSNAIINKSVIENSKIVIDLLIEYLEFIGKKDLSEYYCLMFSCFTN